MSDYITIKEALEYMPALPYDLIRDNLRSGKWDGFKEGKRWRVLKSDLSLPDKKSTWQQHVLLIPYCQAKGVSVPANYYEADHLIRGVIGISSYRSGKSQGCRYISYGIHDDENNHQFHLYLLVEVLDLGQWYRIEVDRTKYEFSHFGGGKLWHTQHAIDDAIKRLREQIRGES